MGHDVGGNAMKHDTLIVRVSLIWLAILAVGCGIGCAYLLTTS